MTQKSFLSKVRLVTQKNAHCYGNTATDRQKTEFSRIKRHVLRLAVVVAVALSVCEVLVGRHAELDLMSITESVGYETADDDEHQEKSHR